MEAAAQCYSHFATRDIIANRPTDRDWPEKLIAEQGQVGFTANELAAAAGVDQDNAARWADAMVAGGAEAAVTPLGVAGFAAAKALSFRNDEPTKASRPFDKNRSGFVMGEGAGIVAELPRRDEGHAPGRQQFFALGLREGRTPQAKRLGDGLILHHLQGRLSSRDVYGGYWQKITTHILRHRTETNHPP